MNDILLGQAVLKHLENEIKGKTGKILTHKEVEHLLDSFMRSNGWIRACLNGPRCLSQHPDRVYQKEKEVVCFEIKPSNCKAEEVFKGIGQATLNLKYGKSLLVIPERIWEYLQESSEDFLFGILSYKDKEEDPILRKMSAFREFSVTSDFRQPNVLFITLKELRTILQHLPPDNYSLDKIIELAQQTYPKRRIIPTKVEKLLLHKLQFPKLWLDPETGKAKRKESGGKPFFRVYQLGSKRRDR